MPIDDEDFRGVLTVKLCLGAAMAAHAFLEARGIKLNEAGSSEIARQLRPLVETAVIDARVTEQTEEFAPLVADCTLIGITVAKRVLGLSASEVMN